MSPSRPHLLVVDDDARLRALLAEFLTQSGFRVSTLADTSGLARVLERDPPHLIVLDWMLPREDGLQACRRLRAAGELTPIIMLTAKGEDEERIEGLEGGADDYLAKPFNPRELLARIQAILRRAALFAPGTPQAEHGLYRFGDCVLDPTTRRLTRQGQVIDLTSAEFALLKVLVQHPQVPLTRERLSMLARGKELDPFDRAIDVQISRLRKLIEPDPAHPRYLQTVWGRGYVFVPDSPSDAA